MSLQNPYPKRILFKAAVLTILAAFVLVLKSCDRDPDPEDPTIVEDEGPIPYEFEIPPGFPLPFLPEDNPLTEEGIQLGRRLFYDPILSRDYSISCATCHKQELGFADDEALSTGIDGKKTDRNSMAIVNMAWVEDFFWDGRSPNLVHQAYQPVVHPHEMDLKWPVALERLNGHQEYPKLFKKAFDVETIDSVHVAKAIEQFELTLVSSDSKYDRSLGLGIGFTPLERDGWIFFIDEYTGDCASHCHVTSNNLMADLRLLDNGLDAVYTDLGLGGVDGNPINMGKFRVPTLRNIMVTGPWMHDGRFDTMEEVLDFYSEHVQQSPNRSPDMIPHDNTTSSNDGNRYLTDYEKEAIIAFLHTFTDSTFLTNPDFANPLD